MHRRILQQIKRVHVVHWVNKKGLETRWKHKTAY